MAAAREPAPIWRPTSLRFTVQGFSASPILKMAAPAARVLNMVPSLPVWPQNGCSSFTNSISTPTHSVVWRPTPTTIQVKAHGRLQPRTIHRTRGPQQALRIAGLVLWILRGSLGFYSLPKRYPWSGNGRVLSPLGLPRCWISPKSGFFWGNRCLLCSFLPLRPILSHPPEAMSPPAMCQQPLVMVQHPACQRPDLRMSHKHLWTQT